MVVARLGRLSHLPKALVGLGAGLSLSLSLSAQTFTWDGEGGDGFWSTAANWDPDGIPNGYGSAAVIESPAPTIMGSSRALNRVVVNEGGQLIITRSAKLTFDVERSLGNPFQNKGDVIVVGGMDLKGAVYNETSIVMGSSAAAIAARLNILLGGARLVGGGEIEMDFRSEIMGTGGGVGVLTIEQQRVHGFGTIRADFVNNDIIAGDVDGEELILLPPVGSIGSSNPIGMLRANNGGILRIVDLTVSSEVGAILAESGGEVRLEGALIIGGSVEMDGGIVRVPNSQDASFIDVRFRQGLVIGNRSDITFNGRMTIDGTMAMTNNSPFPQNFIISAGGARLIGTGRLVLSGSNVGITGASGVTLQNGLDAIEGEGFVGQDTINIHNSRPGVIVANVAGSTLFINPSNLLRNEGLLLANNGSTLRLNDGSLANSGLIEAYGGGAVLGPITLTNNNNGILNGGSYRVTDLGELGGSIALSGPAVTRIGGDAGILLSRVGSVITFGGATLESSIQQIDGKLELLSREFVRTAEGPLTVNGLLRAVSSPVYVGHNLVIGPSGVVTGSGPIHALGIVHQGKTAPGESPGVLVFESNVSLESTATLEIELGGTTPGDEYDQLRVTGDLELGGELLVTPLDGYLPDAGDTFEIVTASNLTGTFSNLAPDGTVTTVDGLNRFRVDTGPTTVTLESVPDAYDAWVAANYPNLTGGFDEDPDGDHVDSGLEWYFHDSDPTKAGSLPEPLAEVIQTGPGIFTFTHRRPIDRVGVSEQYEWSRNLTEWQADGASDGSYDVDFVIANSGETAGEPPGYERVVVTVISNPEDAAALFARLKLVD